ncbi:MAG TPA: RDD family protein [Bryobacteraceae bacterium]|nr:RDD family protein [Bryobacteraceae bacterium]
MRATPARISPATYPIAATATAPAYDFEPETAPISPEAAPGQQAALFSGTAGEPRVIPFASLTSPSERTAIRRRAATSAKADRKRTRVTRSEVEQSRFDFPSEISAAEAAQADARLKMFCETPVATAGPRLQAALFDALVMACGCGPALGLYFYLGGQLSLDKHVLPFFFLALLTIPLYYKLLWALAGKDTPGMRAARLELVDFDGKEPGRDQRFGRLFGSALSLLAAGIGMIWLLVDEERLTWHDHMSGTFPTFSDRRN